MKLSNNSPFVILIFAILKFWNIDRSTFHRSNFDPHPFFQTLFQCDVVGWDSRLFITFYLTRLESNGCQSFVLFYC